MATITIPPPVIADFPWCGAPEAPQAPDVPPHGSRSLRDPRHDRRGQEPTTRLKGLSGHLTPAPGSRLAVWLESRIEGMWGGGRRLLGKQSVQTNAQPGFQCLPAMHLASSIAPCVPWAQVPLYARHVPKCPALCGAPCPPRDPLNPRAGAPPRARWPPPPPGAP